MKLLFKIIMLMSVMTSLALASNPLFDASIRSLDKKFTYYDKEVKKSKYGNNQWERRVEAKKASIEKDLLKIEKKFPKQNLSQYRDELAKRDQNFQNNKLKLTPKAVIKSTEPVKQSNKTVLPKKVKGTPVKVNQLHQLAEVSVNNKMNDYDKVLAKKLYGQNRWFKQLDNSKKIIIKAINNIETRWPDESVAHFYDELNKREKELKNNTFLFIEKMVKSRLANLDKLMKEKQYGQSQWDDHLKKQAKNVSNAINYFAKKWPMEAKPYQNEFNKRVAQIKQQYQRIAKVNKQKEDVKKTTTAKNAVNVKPNKQQVSNVNVLAKVKKDQEQFIKHGKIKVWGNSIGWSEKSDGVSAYLSFSNDSRKSGQNKHSFTGKEYIYAHLHLPKNLTELLPKESAKGMDYYKVTIKASVKSDSLYTNDKTQKNSNRLARKADFVLGYSTKNLTIAVVPEKGFFEDVLNKYRNNDKFEDTATEEKALRDVLSRNFSRQMSNLFKKLPMGEHQVIMEFQVLSKLNQDKYVELKDMKGTFMLTIDQEAKQRYENTFEMLTKLYKSYESQHNIAVGGLDLDAEKKRLAKMNPRERERYNIAKRSPTGYMAAYGGERAKIIFSFGKLRNKNAYIDIVWPKGSCTKCEEGATSVTIRKTASKSFNIPLGARVTLNGRTLINRVDSKKQIPLYWHY